MEITQEIIDSFRAYPLFNGFFSDNVKWPDELIEAALCQADAETGSSGWGVYADDCHNFKQRGMFLYAACWMLSTYPQGVDTGAGIGIGASGQVSSKGVGDESISYATYSPKSQSEASNSWLMAIPPWGPMYLSLRRRAGRGARAL